jgi:hypothetical protein
MKIHRGGAEEIAEGAEGVWSVVEDRRLKRLKARGPI